MKIREHPDWRKFRLSERLYASAEGRGITGSMLRAEIKKMFGVSHTKDLEVEDFYRIREIVKALPLLEEKKVA